MKTLEEYRKYYDERLLPRLEVFEAQRQKALPRTWKFMRWWVYGFFLWAPGSMLLPQIFDLEESTALPLQMGGSMGMLLMALLGVPIWRGVRHKILTRDLSGKVKDEVVVDAIRFLVPDVQYDKGGIVNREFVEESGIFDHIIDHEGDDHFIAQMGETRVEFCELNLTDVGGNQSRTSIVTGMFLMADFKKNFSGRTMLRPDLAEKLFGAVAGDLISAASNFLSKPHDPRFEKSLFHRGDIKGLEYIRMEDPDFEAEFRVLTSDPIEAHYILSPSLMRRLTAFVQHVKTRPIISFVNSKLYLFVITTHFGGLFDVTSFDKLDDFETFKMFYDDLSLALGVVEELNLNTRLWTKEEKC